MSAFSRVPTVTKLAYLASAAVLAISSTLLLVPINAWGGPLRWIICLVVALVSMVPALKLHVRIFGSDARPRDG